MTACPACGAANPERFAFCGACGTPLVDPGAGQRKTVSIVFCDLVDSTVLGSSVDTEVLREVLSGYWTRARAVVERHGGTVEKFIGDAVVGVFGIPVAHEDDALRAVRASADLLVEVQALNKELGARFGIELAVRVGVNTGEVLSGGEALMSGDAANVAARLEAAAGAGEVLLGEATYRLVRDGVAAKDVGPLVVKGKAEPLTAFRLLGVHPAAVVQRRRRFSGPMVGRGRQLRLAEAMYATAVEESSCVLLTVLGESGVGKSRLVDELLAGIGGDALVLRGRCLPYGEGITYWATTEMLTGLAEADRRTLTEHLAEVAHSAEILAGLRTMVGDVGIGDVGTATSREVAWAFRRLVETLAGQLPVVLVVDDAQWAEAGLLDLLDHLTDMSRGASILLVCMARPELQQSRPGWGAARQHSFTMALRPLSDAECRTLTAQLLGPAVSGGLLESVVAAAEGVPLFVEELTAMLVDDGQLVPAVGGGWQLASGLDTVTVPPSVQALLAARLDGLAADLRAVVDAASVVGKVFYTDAVVALVDDDGGTSGRIEALVRTDLVRPTATDLPGHDAYTFNHLLLRDAAYLGLTKARRASLHLALGRWLQHQNDPPVSPEVVAFHLESASTYRTELGEQDPALAQEAAGLLHAAAQRALALADSASAVGLAGRAERMASSGTRQLAEILLTLCEAATQAADYSTAIRCAGDAEQIGAALDDDSVQWQARLQREWVEFWTMPTHRVDSTYALTERAIAALTALNDDRGLTLAYYLRAEAHNRLGSERACAADAREALRHARSTGPLGPSAGPILRRLTCPFRYGDGTPLELEQVLDDIRAEFGAEPWIAQAITVERERLVNFDQHIDEATRVALERYSHLLDKGSTFAAAGQLMWTVAWCQRWAGDLVAALDSMATAAALYGSVGHTGARSSTLAEMSVLMARLGRYDQAEVALAQSRAITQPDDRLNDMNYAAADGLLLAHAGDADGSDRAFRESLRIAGDTEFLVDQGDLWLARSEAQEMLGDVTGALASVAGAMACFERKGQLPPIRTAQARFAELGG